MIVLAGNSEGKAGMAGTKAMAGVITAILVTLTMIPAVAYASVDAPIGATQATVGGAIVGTAVLIVVSFAPFFFYHLKQMFNSRI
jgi:hypothetical protein